MVLKEGRTEGNARERKSDKSEFEVTRAEMAVIAG
jgi:hypothetical protein